MKPRIFISSTFYDLKYIREDISNFVKAHDFDPIMFEDGDIGYTPGKPLDESCYENMKNADMVILIIGGNYGSPASGEKEDAFKEYLSVTRKEFSTAVSEGIPVYAFVESAVYSEFGVYDSNIRKIEEKQIDLVFKATKNINVFRFIKEIYSLGKISVNEFRKPSEIKEFLSKQWSDMFKNYLKILKEKNDSKNIYDAMDNLQSLIKRMDVMVDGLGKKIMGDGHEEVTYNEVLKKQLRIRAKEFAKKIIDNFIFCYKHDIEKKEAVKIAYSSIKIALNNIRKNFKDKGAVNIIEILGISFNNEKFVFLEKGQVDFFLDWEINIEICDNKELDEEVLKILQDDLYNTHFMKMEET